MNAREITAAAGGKWHGTYGTAPCPVCQPEKRQDQCAATLADGRDGRLLAHCKKSGCDFSAIISGWGLTSGHFTYTRPCATEVARRKAAERAEAEKRANQALHCWNAAQAIGGTPAERYLRDVRGVTADLPDTLRYLPDCWHGPAAQRLPAMVARVEGMDLPAIHRTYLLPNGSGKAQVEPVKMMLGNCTGGHVEVARANGPLVIAEGIETALALASGLISRPATIWAALSTSGMVGVHLPEPPHRLTIATDGDDPGKVAGQKLAERAAALGWAVSMLPAPEGKDWADILQLKGAAA